MVGALALLLAVSGMAGAQEETPPEAPAAPAGELPPPDDEAGTQAGAQP